IKEIWKNEIEIYLDHRYVNETLPPMNTTAENMVVWMYEKTVKALNRSENKEKYAVIQVEFIRLYETPTAYAEVRRELMECEYDARYRHIRPNDPRRGNGYGEKDDVCTDSGL